MSATKPPCGYCGHPSGQHEHFMEKASRPCLTCSCSAYTAKPTPINDPANRGSGS
jgi:hypothetical protein